MSDPIVCGFFCGEAKDKQILIAACILNRRVRLFGDLLGLEQRIPRSARIAFAASAHDRYWQILLQKSSSTLLHIRCNATDRILVLITLLRGIAFLKTPPRGMPF
jgi:hypothetical protein